jgi:hypothetical protein
MGAFLSAETETEVGSAATPTQEVDGTQRGFVVTAGPGATVFVHGANDATSATIRGRNVFYGGTQQGVFGDGHNVEFVFHGSDDDDDEEEESESTTTSKPEPKTTTTTHAQTNIITGGTVQGAFGSNNKVTIITTHKN